MHGQVDLHRILNEDIIAGILNDRYKTGGIAEGTALDDIATGNDPITHRISR